MTLRLHTLPEYEPPRRPEPVGPPGADQNTPPPPVPRFAPPPEAPVWDEPGLARERLRRLVCHVLEALDGRRHLTQLTGLVDATVYQSLLTTHRRSNTTGRHLRLRTLRTCRPTPGAVELCATVAVFSGGARPPAMIAVAARVIQRGDGWLCTALRLIYPNPRR